MAAVGADTQSWFEDPDLLLQEVRSSHARQRHSLDIPGYEEVKLMRRGGQGLVFRALQVSTQRKCAIKVLLDGAFASAASRRRFEREIELVAALRHPNIVQIYDSGLSDDDRLYFVMEYVEGRPLDEYCRADSACGQPRAIAELMIKIADAVHYAHQHGVIHRDLKPANIRVSDDGVACVLDFGLAKSAAAPELSALATQATTVSGLFMGSLPWASPEQAEGDPSRIDLRTDVYSLGVVLYQLLTETHPYEVHGSLRFVLQEITTKEPIPPRQHRPSVDDEMETIVLRCLAKDPQRRYASAGHLADDLRRYLAGEPIEAKRDSAWYAVRKTLRRYQFAAVALTFLLALSVAFAITATVLYKRANSAQFAERQARHEAQQKERTATQIREFLETTLTSINPATAKGRDVTLLLEVLDEASNRLESELVDQPETSASLHATLSRTFRSLSRFDEAEKHIAHSHELFLRAFGPDDTRTISALNDIGVMQLEQGRLEDAERRFQEALERSKHVRGFADVQTLEIVSNLAVVLRRSNRLEESESLCREAIAARGESEGGQTEHDFRLMNNLGSVLQEKGGLAEAERYYRQALAGLTELWGEEHPEVMITEANLAHLLSAQQRFDEAETLMRHNLEVAIKVTGKRHTSTLTAMNNLGHLLYQQGKYERAEALHRDALAGRLEVLGPEHEDTLLAMSNLSVCLQSLGELDEAETLQRRSVEILQRVYGPSNMSTMIGINNLASILHKRGNDAAAEPMLADVCVRAEVSLGADHWIPAAFRANHGNTLVSLGRFEEAERILIHSLEVVERVLGPDHSHAKSAREKIIRLYEEWGKPDMAAQYRVPEDSPQEES